MNWNGKLLLEQFLPSVIKYSKEASIYVADNASTDDSVTFLNSNFPQIKVIQNIENGGYAKGYNDALKNLNEDIFCLLNSDVEVTEGWLKPIIETFNSFSTKECAIIQPKIKDFKNKSYFEYAGAAGGFIDKFGYPYCKGRLFNTLEKDMLQYNGTYNIFWASGACLFIRSKTFKSINGFDESFFAHMEEIDLCWRLQNLGYNIKCVTESIVYHVGGASLDNQDPKKTFLNFRNSLYTLVKNAKGNIIYLIMVRLILDGVAGLKFLLELKPKHTLAIINAHLSFYNNFRRLIKQRKSITPKAKYYKISSIVYTYFFKHKTTYNSL